MRLLFVTETYPPEINGVAMTTHRMVLGLRQRGHWVGIVRPRQSPADSGGDEEWTVPSLPLPRYPGLRLGLPVWRRLNTLMRSLRPDLVHVVTEGPLGWAALLTGRSMGLPVSSGYHTHFDQYFRHYGLRPLAPLATRVLDGFHRRCTATLVPTKELAQALAARGIANVHVLGRGVDTTLFSPQRRSLPLREAWGASESDLVCLYVGRLAYEKNLDLVVRAYQAIAHAQPHARMVWVGDGPALAQLRSLHPQHIFAGYRKGEDLATHYASADLFLFPSLTETWGNVLGEAMASGLAVVAYHRAAASCLIRPGENGLTAPPGDEAAFLACATRLAADGPLRVRLGRQAAQDMGENAWTRIISELEVILAQASGQA